MNAFDLFYFLANGKPNTNTLDTLDHNQEAIFNLVSLWLRAHIGLTFPHFQPLREHLHLAEGMGCRTIWEKYADRHRFKTFMRWLYNDYGSRKELKHVDAYKDGLFEEGLGVQRLLASMSTFGGRYGSSLSKQVDAIRDSIPEASFLSLLVPEKPHRHVSQINTTPLRPLELTYIDPASNMRRKLRIHSEIQQPLMGLAEDEEDPEARRDATFLFHATYTEGAVSYPGTSFYDENTVDLLSPRHDVIQLKMRFKAQQLMSPEGCRMYIGDIVSKAQENMVVSQELWAAKRVDTILESMELYSEQLRCLFLNGISGETYTSTFARITLDSSDVIPTDYAKIINDCLASDSPYLELPQFETNSFICYMPLNGQGGLHPVFDLTSHTIEIRTKESQNLSATHPPVSHFAFIMMADCHRNDPRDLQVHWAWNFMKFATDHKKQKP